MNNEPIKVLHMTKLGAGGISTLTVNINSLLDLSKVKFDYLVFEDEKTFYEDKIKQFGAEKRIVDVTQYQNKKLLLYWKKYVLTKKMLKQYKYDVVHVDASTPMDIVIGLAAKHAGVKCIVLHSHIAGDNKHSIFRTIYLNVCRQMMLNVFTDYLAISHSSAEFMFPKKIYRKQDYHIIRNGILADKYIFNKKERDDIRKELRVENDFVIGHVGRFSIEKNHDFILDVFRNITEKRSNVKLLLVGDGKLKNDIVSKIREYELEDKVILYGTSQDIPRLLMAMDVFVFPSHYEGLGIVAIEAQCSGMPTFCSDGIPSETEITDLFHRINGYDEEEWAEQLMSENQMNRVSRIADVRNAGFDLQNVAEYLQNCYIKGNFNSEDNKYV